MARWQDIGLGAFGLLIVAWALGDWVQIRGLASRGAHAEGQVTRKWTADKIRVQDWGDDHLISYTFAANGRTIEQSGLKVQESVWHRLPETGPIDVVYLPGSPTRSRPALLVAENPFPSIAVGLGLALTAVGAFYLVSHLRRGAK